MSRRLFAVGLLLAALAGCKDGDGGVPYPVAAERATTSTTAGNALAAAAAAAYPQLVGPWERAVTACLAPGNDAYSADPSVKAMTNAMEAATAAAKAFDEHSVFVAALIVGADPTVTSPAIVARFSSARSSLLACDKAGIGSAATDLDWLKGVHARLVVEGILPAG